MIPFIRDYLRLEQREKIDIVLIHDGARPFVTAEMISASIACARECGACTVGVPAKDTIKIVDTDHYGVETPDEICIPDSDTADIQVPLLRRAYETMYEAKKKWRHPQYNG